MADAVNPKYEDTAYAIRGIDGTKFGTHVRRGFLADDGSPEIDPETGKQRKTYYWRGLEGNASTDAPLYRTPQLVNNERQVVVIVAEGIAATDALIDKGFLAVGTVTGAASTPSDTVLETLRGRTVYLWPDNDEVGHKHMKRIADRLLVLGIDTRLIDWKDAPAKGDAADLIESQNGTANSLIDKLIQTAEHLTPPETGLIVRSGSALADVYFKKMQMIEDAAARGIRHYIPTGFDRLDHFFSGGLYPGLYSLHAQTGIGKSALMLQIAIQSKTPTLYISTETPTDEITLRIMCQTLDRKRRDFQTGNLDPVTERELVGKAFQIASHVHIVEPTTDTPLTRQWVEDKLVQLKKASPDGHAILIIDSLHSWALGLAASDPNFDERRVIDVMLSRLDKMWKELQVPIIMVTERDKHSMSKAVNDKSNNAQAGSRRLAFIPGQILSIDNLKQDEDYLPDVPKEVVLKIGKSKLGPQDVRIDLLFDRQTMKFYEA